MKIDCALGNACSFGDIIEPGCGIAAVDELIQRSIDNGLTPIGTLD
jgi:hypothetical protein